MAKTSAQRQLGALVEAGMVLASELDLESLLQRIADLSRDVVGAAYGAVGVVGEEGELIRFVYSGIDKQTADRIGHLPTGRGVLGALLEQDRPLRLHEISDHSRSYGFPQHHPPMHTFLGVPIVVRRRVFGRLYLTEKHGGSDFTKDDERIAMTLASQAGVAIENARLYDEIRSSSEELRHRVLELSSMERVGDLLISGSTIDDLLHSAVIEAVHLTGATRGVLFLLQEQTDEMVVRESAGTGEIATIGTRLAAGTSKAHGVLVRQAGEVVGDLGADPEVDQDARRSLRDPKSGAFVPLIVRGKGIGTLAVYDPPKERTFSSDDLTILQILANQAAIALENDRLTEALRDMAVLEERERIAKELHDGVIQSIYSVGLALQGSVALLRKDPDSANARIDQAIAELDNVVRDVRNYIFELRPRMLEEHGIGVAIAELVRELEVNTLAHITLRLEEDATATLGGSEQMHVVQIVREILSNIARHARASEVELLCRLEDGHVELHVSHDGTGFDPDSVERGHGLRNMEERARLLGGTLEIVRRKDGGMRHLLRVPSGPAPS